MLSGPLKHITDSSTVLRRARGTAAWLTFGCSAVVLYLFIELEIPRAKFMDVVAVDSASG